MVKPASPGPSSTVEGGVGGGFRKGPRGGVRVGAKGGRGA